MQRTFLITLALIGLAAAGCGSGSSSSSSSETSASATPFHIPNENPPIRYEKEMKLNSAGLSGREPKPVIPNQPPPDSLSLSDLKAGIGELAKVGQEVTIQYVGYDYETKKKFVSSWDQGHPYTFTLGKGEVIPAWEEGIPEMEIGDEREMVVPPELAEGPYPPGIPKGKAVVFVVETLPKENPGGAAGKPQPKWEKVKPQKAQPKVSVPKGAPPKKLVVNDLKEGSGPGAKAGDELEVQYVGVVYRSGKVFENQWGKPGPHFSFQLGSESVIPGWEEGLEGIKLGGQRELIIPPEQAYGAQRTGSIPPYSTLIFVIEAVGIKHQ